MEVFTESDLSVNLTVILERNFLHYLDELQESIIKQTEKNELTKSISNYYIARGMGLYSGEQHKKTVFYVYSNIKNTNGVNSNIIIHIRGPYGTYGKAVIPKFHSDLFTIPEINVTSESLMTRKLLQKNCKDPRNNFLKSFSLPFMQYKKKHMGDNIVIDVTLEDDRAKVTYIPNNYGIYEINMIANGELIRGCPFNVHILNNTSGVEENFENLRKVEEIPCIKKKKGYLQNN
ncbi:hypothetical protein NQ314_019301 [Rhamnusium bicolor]|uniref:Uncharacterized protein n=1 Tax=Rhamnusium bicolor TaxID=1586634 RepID=A0AAV8WNT0_9CUCU|nr:hypothetical protein NQ314_019301 [Rhamnusium bicolor]